MQDADLYLELAAIAGVFVGFGALIAVRGGGPSEPEVISPVRIVVAMGVLAVIAALAPVTLDRYDLSEHQTLALSSGIVMVCFIGLSSIHVRSPEYKAYAATATGGMGPTVVIALVAWVTWLVGTALTPIVIVLGVAPDLEAALYFTVLVLLLGMAAWSLMTVVFAQRQRAEA